MQYKLDRELEKAARLKMPANIRLLPAMNTVISSLYRCKPDDKVEVTEYKTPGYDGTSLDTLVIEPRHCGGKLPGMVFFHGGGFMLKASGAHYRIAKAYAEKVPCRVIYVDYRLAPKYRFPVPAEDCYCTYKWALENLDMLKIDSEKIIIAGDSAGGNLALAVSLMAGDRGLPMPKAEMLIYPATDRRMQTESMKKYTDSPVWDARLSEMMWKAYLGEQVPEKVEYASPAEAVSLAHFPPTYIEVAQFDPLHDEGVLFFNRLREQGVDAQLHEVPGSCHGFETALESSLLKTCMDRRIAWIRNTIEG